MYFLVSVQCLSVPPPLLDLRLLVLVVGTLRLESKEGPLQHTTRWQPAQFNALPPQHELVLVRPSHVTSHPHVWR